MKMKKIVFVLSLSALFKFATTIAQETNETTNTTTEAVATTPAEEDIVMAKETINVGNHCRFC